MDRIQAGLINYLQFKNNFEDEYKLDSAEWIKVHKLAMAHSLSTIIFPTIHSLPGNQRPSTELLNSWKKQVIVSVSEQYNNIEQVRVIFNLLKANNIYPIMLKGLSVARLYEHPEFRTMADLDIIVNPNQQKETKKLIESMGYKLDGTEMFSTLHLCYDKETEISIELHRKLYYSRYIKTLYTQNWNENIWENTCFVEYEGLNFYIMSAENMIINQLLHFTMHFAHMSANLKQLYDVAAIINSYDKKINWGYIEKTIEEMQIISFARIVFGACRTYFKINVPSTMTEQRISSVEYFMNLMFNGFAMEKMPGENWCFSFLMSRTPILCKYKIYLPLVWVLEVIVQITKLRNPLNQAFKNAYCNTGLYASRKIILQKLGLM